MRVFFLVGLLLSAFNVQADRLKDIASVEGVRENQLFGYGLVIGLNSTGDNNAFTDQSFTGMLSQFGIVLPEGENANSQNVAAVSITATLPPLQTGTKKLILPRHQ